MLLGADERTRTANLQVSHGDAHTAAQVLELGESGETCRGLLGERKLAREHEVRVRLGCRTTDTALELIELRQAQALRVLDDEGVRARVVDSALHDGGGDEHVDLLGGELHHHILDLARAHLTVRHSDARLRRRLEHALDGVVDGLHAVGHVVDLAATPNLQTNSRAHHIRVVLTHMHGNRAAPRRRRGNETHVADATHGHLHGAWDGRRRKREHVDLLAHVFKLLLMLDAETLLLVDDDQAELMRVHIGREQAMCADEHVDLTLGKRGQRTALLRGRAEARKHLDLHAKGREALEERLVMLLGENRRGAQDHDLTPTVDTLERGTQGDFGLSKTHVAAKQAIHGLGRLHVGLDVGNGIELVARLVVRKALLHLDLARAVRPKGEARDGATACIQIDQIEREFLSALAGLGGGATPVGGVETRETRVVAVGTDVARDTVDLLERHVQLVAARILQHEVIALLAAHLLANDLGEQCDTVRGVNHVVTRLERERHLGDVHATTWASALAVHARIEVGQTEHSQMSRRYHHAGRNGDVDESHATARDGGHGHGALLEAACVERIDISLEQGDGHIRSHMARVFRRCLQRLLERDGDIGERELHRLARPAIGDGEHAGIAVVHHLLDTTDESVVGA